MEITISIKGIGTDDKLTRAEEQAITQAVNELISDNIDLERFDVDAKFYRIIETKSVNAKITLK